MSRIDGNTSETIAKLLYEETSSAGEKTTLRALLDAAQTSHTHTLSDISDSGAALDLKGDKSGTLAQFAATTAAQLNSVLSDASLTGTNTGDQDLSTYQLKPTEGAFVDGDKTKLDAITGTNTGDQDPIDTFGFACSDETTLLTSGEKIVFYAPYAFTITDIYASLNTAPTVQAVTVDVESPAGTSLLTSVLSIATAAFTDEETGMSKVIAKGDRISIDIDQIDTAGAAAGLKIFITHTRT